MSRKKLWFSVVVIGLILVACAPQATPAAPTLVAETPASMPTGAPTTPALAVIPPGAESLCEAAFSSPVTEGSASIPVRTLVNKEYEGAGWDRDPNTMVIPHDEPRQASQVHSLVCIRENRVQEATYPDGEVGYRVVWNARLVAYPDGEVRGAQDFEGGPPPDAERWEMMKAYFPPPAYGERPEGSLLEWLFPLLGERTVFCHGSSVYAIALSPDGKLLASGGSSNIVSIWDLATGEAMPPLALGDDVAHVDALAFSPDGKTLALPGEWLYPVLEPIRLWSVATGEVLLRFSTDELLVVYSLAFSPDGKMLASGDWDGAVHLWDVASGRLLRSLSAHTELVSSLAFSSDGDMLASASYDGTVVLWDVAAGQPLNTLDAHSDFVSSVAFSPDGTMLASGSLDNTVILWDVSTGQPLQTLRGEDHVSSVAFSPDGKTLASGEVLQVKLWDVATGAMLRVLEGHSKAARSLAFLPDGNRLASGSMDTTIKLWEVAAGQ
jgi:hypothetical protein